MFLKGGGIRRPCCTAALHWHTTHTVSHTYTHTHAYKLTETNSHAHIHEWLNSYAHSPNMVRHAHKSTVTWTPTSIHAHTCLHIHIYGDICCTKMSWMGVKATKVTQDGQCCYTSAEKHNSICKTILCTVGKATSTTNPSVHIRETKLYETFCLFVSPLLTENSRQAWNCLPLQHNQKEDDFKGFSLW